MQHHNNSHLTLFPCFECVILRLLQKYRKSSLICGATKQLFNKFPGSTTLVRPLWEEISFVLISKTIFILFLLQYLRFRFSSNDSFFLFISIFPNFHFNYSSYKYTTFFLFISFLLF